MLTGALKPAGRAVFTVESHDYPTPYRLNETGRYSHSLSGVQDSVRQAGLELVSATTHVLRTETGSPVQGYLVTVHKP